MRSLARVVGVVCGWVLLGLFFTALIFNPAHPNLDAALFGGFVTSTLFGGFVFGVAYWNYKESR